MRSPSGPSPALLQDRAGVQAAFQALLAAALEGRGINRRQPRAIAQAGQPTRGESDPITPRGPTPPELPLLMQSELGPALRQLTPRRSSAGQAAA